MRRSLLKSGLSTSPATLAARFTALAARFTATEGPVATAPARIPALKSWVRVLRGLPARPLKLCSVGAKAALLLLLPLPLVQMPSARAEAARYALACIGTETGWTVNFSYRWGSEGWRQMSVEPGKWIKLYWTYDYPGQNRSPTLLIRYDDDLSSSSNMVRTELRAYAAAYLDCEKQGKTYNFYTRGNELYVQEED